MTVDIIRQLALTGCRRTEMIKLQWAEADTDASCLRLVGSKEGASIRPIGLPVVEYLENRRTDDIGTYVFPGQGDDNAFGSFPNHWEKIFEDTPLSDITPHVLRHSFASIANDLGFTEVTIAALVGHAKVSVTSKYIHTLDTALIMAADTISGYIQGLFDGVEFKQTAYSLDRDSRKAALARFLRNAVGQVDADIEEQARLAA
jgi:integrase